MAKSKPPKRARSAQVKNQPKGRARRTDDLKRKSNDAKTRVVDNDADKEKVRDSTDAAAQEAETRDAPRRDDSYQARKRELINALEESLGAALFACQRVGIPYAEYRKLLQEDAELAEVARLNEERALDFVEGKALEEIRKGNARLIQFYLQAKGKGRGYGVEQPLKERDSQSANPTKLLDGEELGY